MSKSILSIVIVNRGIVLRNASYYNNVKLDAWIARYEASKVGQLLVSAMNASGF